MRCIYTLLRLRLFRIGKNLTHGGRLFFGFPWRSFTLASAIKKFPIALIFYRLSSREIRYLSNSELMHFWESFFSEHSRKIFPTLRLHSSVFFL